MEHGFFRAKLNHRVDAHESNESEHDVQVGHFAARASYRVARGGAYAELDEINQSTMPDQPAPMMTTSTSVGCGAARGGSSERVAASRAGSARWAPIPLPIAGTDEGGRG